jgi:phosphoglycerate kinase
LLAEKFSPAHRTIGLLIEKELAKLNGILEHPKKPFMLIIGGGKVADKLPMLANLLGLVDCIALGPAIVFTFLKAENKEVGLSLVEDEQMQDCKAMLALAQEKNVRILFPVDYQIAMDSFKGPLTSVSADNFPANGVGISVGPKTQKLWNTEIMHAGTILYNGLMGDPTRPETLHGSAALITAMSQSSGFSLLAGGNTVGAAQQLNLSQSIDYLSTGGGATLAYLSGTDLPGLKAFI